MTNHLPTVPFAPSSCELGQNRARSFHKARDRFTDRPIMCGKNARCIFLGPAARATARVVQGKSYRRHRLAQGERKATIPRPYDGRMRRQALARPEIAT